MIIHFKEQVYKASVVLCHIDNLWYTFLLKEGKKSEVSNIYCQDRWFPFTVEGIRTIAVGYSRIEALREYHKALALWVK